MPIGVSDCGCEIQEDTTLHQLDIQPWISDQDLVALQAQGIEEGWTFTVGTNTATKQALSQLCGFVETEESWIDASFDPCLPTATLPSSFDWRELGGCTPIKNQGGCGSCWAFGTIAPIECNILIKDHVEVDLSEQWLVSCNQNSWGCRNGGWWAHSYFHWKMDQCNGTGAVLEEDFPYVARDVPCDGPYAHPYTIDTWHYVGFSQGTAQIDAIKQAIMTYGPVSTACAVTQAFAAYTGGIFNENDPNAELNHAVALVGWDDTQGTNGIWFLRNSWGTGWGEDGYMRIEYDVCKVGYATCYVVYPPKTTVDIAGGVLGPSVTFKNICDSTTTDMRWEIVISGGILGATSIRKYGEIDSLEPSTMVSKYIPCFGFGPIKISVSVIPKNAGRIAKNAEGFLVGSHVFFLHSL